MTLQSDEGRQSRTEDARKRRQFFAMVPMRAADNLMKALQLDEAKYRGVAGHAQQDARAYFLYGAIDEVFKVCTATLRWAEFIDAPEEDAKALENSANEAARHMHRVVIESVLDEQHMWSRKLTELLIDLILFQTTNQQDCYRLYLACAFLDAYLRLQQDFAEFFACRSGNADATIEGVLSEARALLARIGSGVWFARLSPTRPPTPGAVFTSARQRFIRAVEAAEPDQRTALGISYEGGYSMPSRSIHRSIGDPGRRRTERRQVDLNIGRLGLLTGHIVLVAHKLAGVQPTGSAESLASALTAPNGAEAFAAVIQTEFETGDIVFAYGNDVCEIIDSAKSRYGYTSYKIRYLSRPMLEELPEDWFPAREIHLLIPRKALRRKVGDLLKSVGAAPEVIAQIESVPDAEVSRLVASAVRAWDMDGTLPRLLGLE